jgi:predicted MFS family arabinose efflux permease
MISVHRCLAAAPAACAAGPRAQSRFPSLATGNPSPPVTIPPRLLTLQLLNACIGGASYLGVSTATGMWTSGGWSPGEIGTAMAATNLAYGALVSQGGRLSDRWGRARTAMLGAAICASGAALPLTLAVPWAALVGIFLVFAGSAFFFPGNVGLFSDAQGDAGTGAPLHVKVSRYNLGWSGGNLAGFGLACLLSAYSPRLGWALVLTAALAAILSLWRWRNLPVQPPRAEGDRSGHPALGRLIWMGRAALLIYCLLGMAFISLLTRALKGEGLDAVAAQSMASAGLFTYALGYFAMFVLLGAWPGWVLRPWRLLALQTPIIIAALAVLWLGNGPVPPTLALCGVSLLLGIGFGAVYTGSIYYSLRLPEGAARAAALHETALGIGSTAGPLLCGVFMSVAADGALGALGIWLVAVSAIVIGLQAVVIPGAARLGAR